MGDETTDRVLQYFNGRPPSWRLAMSAAVPQRGLVDQIRNRFRYLEDASKPAVVTLLGPGSEGKSTIFLQTLGKLVREDGWIVLWRYNDSQQIDADSLQRAGSRYPKLIVAVDEAHSIAGNLANLLRRRRGPSFPHFLLCSRSLDWRAEIREMSTITSSSDYQEVPIRGIDRADAEKIVAAWATLGKDGLGALEKTDSDTAVDALLSAAQNEESEEDESALFGAMLKLRYGDKLKDRIRSILYKLNDMRSPGRPILEAYTMIAAMDAEGLRFLSLPVLAEHFGTSASEFQKNTIAPLADEAVAAGGGRFVLCRHKAIATASLAVLRETNLFGDINIIYSELGRAAITARSKGIFVPDLQKWDYDLPSHFKQSGRTLIAVAASEQMHYADPEDIHLRVNLSKVYRESGQIDKAVRLFRNNTTALSRAAWHEWSVGERWNHEYLTSIILAAVSLCDIPATPPVIRLSAAMSMNTIAQNLVDLYHRYVDPAYLTAIVAATKIAVACSDADSHGMTLANEALEVAMNAGAPDVENSECVATFKIVIGSVLQLVDFDDLAKGRVPRSAVGSYNGLSALFTRQRVPQTTVA